MNSITEEMNNELLENELDMTNSGRKNPSPVAERRQEIDPKPKAKKSKPGGKSKSESRLSSGNLKTKSSSSVDNISSYQANDLDSTEQLQQKKKICQRKISQLEYKLFVVSKGLQQRHFQHEQSCQ